MGLAFEDFIENSAAAFVRISLADGEILLANPKASSLFHTPETPFQMGTSVFDHPHVQANDWRALIELFSAPDAPDKQSLNVHIANGDQKRLAFSGTMDKSGPYLDLVITEVDPCSLVMAVDCLSEALTIYDKNDKRVFANAHFLEQNTDLPETSVLGTTFEAYVRSLVKSGRIAGIEGDEEAWVRERLQKHQSAGEVFILNRGEQGWMQVDEQRLPDGGTVILSSDITSLKQNEIIVGETAARFKRIMSFSPIGAMIVRTDGLFRYVNEKGAEGFGLTREQMEGRRSHEFYADLKDRDRVVAELDETGFVTDRQTLLKRVDGSTFWALISIYYDPDNSEQFIAWYYNIDELLRAHRKLVELTAAIEAMSEPVAMFDEDDRFVFTNEAFRKEASGSDFRPVIGTPFADYITAAAYSGAILNADGNEEKWIAERMRQHSQPSASFEITFNNGKSFQGVEKKLSSGSSILLLTDITELKKTLNELSLAKEKAEIADNAKSEFLATISHELRTPLTSIKGSIGLLTGIMAEDFSNEVKSLLEMANRNSDTLLSLINDLLDFEKILTGNMVMTMGLYDLGGLTKDLIETIDGYAETLHVDLVCETPPEPAVAEIDKQRFEQVLSNLISNAAKFSNKGDTVLVKVEEHQKRVRVSVIDKGIGIPKKDLDRIFERFTQVDSSDIRSKNGTGLGLPISKALVTSMGGVIGCHSFQGEGSTFYVEFEQNS